MINYEDLITVSQLKAVQDTAAKLDIETIWLLGVMYIESRLNPAAVNATTGATGLIQFMPSTASSLGTTTAALKQMSFVDQMEYVYKYMLPYKGKMTSFVDCYLAIFFPAAIGKPDSYVLQTSKLSAALIAKQNSIYDTNKDGQITKGEIAKYIEKYFQKKKMIALSAAGVVAAVAVGILVYELANRKRK